MDSIDEKFMREALAEARAAGALGEVSIGAVVACGGQVIARAHNRRELDQDPSAHAEFAAVCAAARALGRWRLPDCTVYVTLEPCAMCAGLMVNARVGRCVYGAANAKAGALGSLYDLNADARLNHSFNVVPGVLGDECAELLSGYFAGLRVRRDGVAGAMPGCGCGGESAADIAHAEAAHVEPTGASQTRPVSPRPRRVLLAIDSFKGSASSAEVEAWAAEGVHRTWPGAQVECLPIADGGEGTLDAVAAARGLTAEVHEVAGPLDSPVSARLLIDHDRREAVVEMAQAAGITLSPRTAKAARAASTRGVGELLLAALDAGARTIYIGLGGSATTDGGAGLLQALGARVLGAEGEEVAFGLEGLAQVATIDLAPALGRLDGARIIALSDVTNPLVGRRGAVAVFGGQKGLPVENPEQRAKMDMWMLGYGRALDAAIASARADGLLPGSGAAGAARRGRTFASVLGVPGAGAAGGLGAALLALGGELVSGIEAVLDLAGFEERAKDADLVVTGEGNMDAQSAAGKAPVGIARRAKRMRKPVAAIVGGRSEDLSAVYEQGIDLVVPVCRKPMSLERALEPAETRANVICAAEAVARAYDMGRIF